MQHLLSAASADPENSSVLLVGAAATCVVESPLTSIKLARGFAPSRS